LAITLLHYLGYENMAERIEIFAENKQKALRLVRRSGQAFKAVNSKGVGLYIAKLIIVKHGWRLDIDSGKDAGTRISVSM
jgi:K+-sensing histidine kinase KdpD